MSRRSPALSTVLSWQSVVYSTFTRNTILLVLFWPILLTLIPIGLALAALAMLAQIVTWPVIALVAAAGVMLTHLT